MMQQDTRYIFLVLLSSLLILTGCSRRDILDDYPVSGVDIELNWEGVAEKLPEGVRVIFYPKNAEGRKMDTYLSARGGKVKVPPGRYSVVAYNYDTETVQIRGEEAYETIEAFTGHCNGLGMAGTEEMVWGPDPLYVVQIDDIKIENSEEELQLRWKPKLVVKTYIFNIKVEGLEHVASIFGSVDGMSGYYCLGKGSGRVSDDPIFFEATGKSGEVTGSFTAFGRPEGSVSRAGGKIKLTLAFVKVDKTVQKAEIDITEIVADAEKGSGGGDEGGGDGDDDDDGDVVDPPTEIELPLDNLIEVDKPSTDPDHGGGGGFDGDVDDWGKEDEVVLPVG